MSFKVSGTANPLTKMLASSISGLAELLITKCRHTPTPDVMSVSEDFNCSKYVLSADCTESGYESESNSSSFYNLYDLLVKIIIYLLQLAISFLLIVNIQCYCRIYSLKL